MVNRQQIIAGLYDSFVQKDFAAIVAKCTADCKWEFPDKNIPYGGTWTAGDGNGRDIKDFFPCVGAAWGEKATVIEMIWSNFKVEGDRVTNGYTIRLLTTDGRVINGTDTHTWDVNDQGKIYYHMNDCAAHSAAYAPGGNQAELMAKLCWGLFGEGKHEAIIAHTQHEKAVFTLMTDGDQALAKKVPYAGTYKREDMMQPFSAMKENWVFDEQFQFAPTSFEAKGDVCIMNAKMNANTKAGKKIQFEKEGHQCDTAIDANGCRKVTAWTVSGSTAAHAAGF